MAKLNIKKLATPQNLLIGGGAVAVIAFLAFKMKDGGLNLGGLNAATDASTEVYFDVEPVEGHAMFLKGYFKHPQTGQRKVVSQGYYYILQDFNNRTVLVKQGVLGTNISEFYTYVDMSSFPRGGYTIIVSSEPVPREQLAPTSIGASQLGGMGIRGNLPGDKPGLQPDRPEFANVPVSKGGGDFFF
jgi:hypothetical protein